MLRKPFFTLLIALTASLPIAAEPRAADYRNLMDGSTGYAFTCLSLPSTPVSVINVSQRIADKSYLVALDNYLRKEKEVNPAWCAYQGNASGRNPLTPILGLIPGLVFASRLSYTLNSRLISYTIGFAMDTPTNSTPSEDTTPAAEPPPTKETTPAPETAAPVAPADEATGDPNRATPSKARTCKVETWIGITDYDDLHEIPHDRLLVKVREFKLAADGAAIAVTQTSAGEATELPNPGQLTWTVDMKTHRLFVTSSTLGEIRRYHGVCFGKEEKGTRTPTGLNLHTWSPKWMEKDSSYVSPRDRTPRTRIYDFYHVAETAAAAFRRFNRNVHAGLTRIENHDYYTPPPENLHPGYIYGGLPRIRYNYKSPGNDYYGFAFHGREDVGHPYGRNHSHGCCHLPPEVIKEAFFLANQWYRSNPTRSIAVKIYWDKEAGVVHRPGTEATYGRLDQVTGY